MSIWSLSTENYATLSYALVAFDYELQIDVTLAPTSSVTGAFLYTDSNYAGYVSAKLSGWSSYLPLGIYNLRPVCFLGELRSDSTYDLSLKISIPESSGLDGEQIIPIRIGINGMGDAERQFLFEDSNDFWYSNPEEANAGWWK